MRMQAVFNGVVIAESDDTVVVDGNLYFPEESLHREHLRSSDTWSICPWKGKASHFTVEVGGVVIDDAAWTYRHPSPLARQIKDHVAFRKGVEVRPAPEESSEPPR